jgi:hypothetical protein
VGAGTEAREVSVFKQGAGVKSLLATAIPEDVLSENQMDIQASGILQPKVEDDHRNNYLNGTKP